MDGRQVMAFSGGSAPYYIHRGGVSGSGGPGIGTHSGGFQGPTGFIALSNVRDGSGSSTFSVEPPHAGFGHGIDTSSSPVSGVIVPSSGEPVKKKRGRPRKYGPGGPVSLRLSPMSATADSTPGSTTPSKKRRKGRPPGSGRKQQLATLGEWMNNSAGLAFSPHVIIIESGEDVVAKLLSFSQQRPRALCIMSGTGTVSSVTLRQPASTSVNATYKGRFQILCLSGSYLVAEDGGPRNRTGGMSVSLSSPDSHVFGGGVASLVSASPVQVVVCSFVYDGSKPKTKEGTAAKDTSSEPQSSDKLGSPTRAPPDQNYPTSSAKGIWPGSGPVDSKTAQPHAGIDLTRG